MATWCVGCVVSVARDHATKDAGLELPRSNPFLAAGEALVLHTTDQGTVVAIERHLPNIG